MADDTANDMQAVELTNVLQRVAALEGALARSEKAQQQLQRERSLEKRIKAALDAKLLEEQSARRVEASAQMVAAQQLQMQLLREHLLEERMNKHILTCDGVDGCREMSMSSTHTYGM